VGCLLSAAARAEVVDRVVLRVNDRIATLLDYEERRAEGLSEIRSRDDLQPDQREQMRDELGNRVFRKMFEDLLLLSRADQLSIHPDESEVDAGVRQIRESFGIKSDDEFAAALSQEGMSLAEFREQVRDQIRIRQVIGREVTAKIDVEEDDLRRIYRSQQDQFVAPKRWRVRELIVLENDQVDTAELLRLAESIRGQILAGRAIDEVADEYSKKGTTSGLVELGWVGEGELSPALESALSKLSPGGEGELSPALESALSKLSPGDLSEPIQARGGYHIMQLEEFEDAHTLPFSEVQDKIEAQERRRMFAQKFQDYMHNLEQQAYVVADPPPDAAGFRTVAGDRGDADPYADFEPVPAKETKKKEARPVPETPDVQPEISRDKPPPP